MSVDSCFWNRRILFYRLNKWDVLHCFVAYCGSLSTNFGSFHSQMCVDSSLYSTYVVIRVNYHSSRWNNRAPKSLKSINDTSKCLEAWESPCVAMWCTRRAGCMIYSTRQATLTDVHLIRRIAVLRASRAAVQLSWSAAASFPRISMTSSLVQTSGFLLRHPPGCQGTARSDWSCSSWCTTRHQ